MTYAIMWNATTHKSINLETPLVGTFAESGATCVVVTSSEPEELVQIDSERK